MGTIETAAATAYPFNPTVRSKARAKRCVSRSDKMRARRFTNIGDGPDAANGVNDRRPPFDLLTDRLAMSDQLAR